MHEKNSDRAMRVKGGGETKVRYGWMGKDALGVVARVRGW